MLAHIEALPEVDEAWMSRDGTMVLVRARADVSTQVEALLSEAGDRPARLTGVNYETVMELYDPDTWVRANTADALSAEEAIIVAARISNRVEDLSEADRLAVAELVQRAFAAAIEGDGRSPEEWVDHVVEEAAAFLDEAERRRLRAALEAGVGPLEGEP